MLSGGISIGSDIGYDDVGKKSTISFKAGVSVGLGVATPVNGTVGGGYATPAIPIIRFGSSK